MKTSRISSMLLAPAYVLAQNSSYATFIYNSSEASTRGNLLVWSMNVVESTGDIYFHMTAPQSGSWAAVGFGSQMAGSLMMVAYPSRNGSGITISPRIATGHSEPTYQPSIEVDKVWDSDLTTPNYIDNNNNVMYIDGICRNCTSWPGGSLDLKSTAAPLIFAVGPGLNMYSDALDAGLQRHEFYGGFDMDLTAATSQTQGQVPPPKSGQYVVKSATAATYALGTTGISGPSHAVMMLLAWLIIFPVGSLVLRIFNKLILHIIVQGLGVILVCAASGIGIYISAQYNRTKHFSSAHQVIGLSLMAGVFVQLGLGIVGHRIYKTSNVISKLAKAHMILGSILFLFAAINGGLGLSLGNLSDVYLYYAIVVIAIFIIYVPLRIVAHCCARRRKKQNAADRVDALADDGYQYPQFVAAKQPHVQAYPMGSYSGSQQLGLYR